jgi:hypothetical protein
MAKPLSQLGAGTLAPAAANRTEIYDRDDREGRKSRE